MRLFVAVYEERSFTAAALREHATQSGVSQRIGKIEARFRVKLFIRETGSVVPTPAGENYYSHCLAVLRSNDTGGPFADAVREGAGGADHGRPHADHDPLRAGAGPGGLLEAIPT